MNGPGRGTDRPRHQPRTGRRDAYIAGLFDVRYAEQPIPTLVPAADWLRLNVAPPGEFAPVGQGNVLSHNRTLDLCHGALLSGSRIVAPGFSIQLRMLRLGLPKGSSLFGVGSNVFKLAA